MRAFSATAACVALTSARNRAMAADTCCADAADSVTPASFMSYMMQHICGMLQSSTDEQTIFVKAPNCVSLRAGLYGAWPVSVGAAGPPDRAASRPAVGGHKRQRAAGDHKQAPTSA